VINADTSCATNKFTMTQPAAGGNCQTGGSAGNDLVYAVTPQNGGGTLTAALTNVAYADPLIEIRSACADASTNLEACQGSLGLGVSTSYADVQGGSTYYVVVDSFGNDSGAFTLTITLN